MCFLSFRSKALFTTLLTFALSISTLQSFASTETFEVIDLDVIDYNDFVNEEPESMDILMRALFQKGVAGIKGVPGYKEKYRAFVDAARTFTALSEEEKEKCAPNRDLGETFLGYESGKEKFQLPDGRWVIDNLKVSYYAHNPDGPENKWPKQIDLQTPYSELASVMSATGIEVMNKIGMIGPGTEIDYNNAKRVVRMLYYKKTSEGQDENPYWCGAHFDHCLLTAILPAVYYKGEIEVPEPIEAGLFVRTRKDEPYKKIIADDLDVMMFQVGEFGQLSTNDRIRATEHRVHKAVDGVERYTMAAFFNAPMDAVIHSYSELTSDERYGAGMGEACSFEHWHLATFNRFLVKED